MICNFLRLLQSASRNKIPEFQTKLWIVKSCWMQIPQSLIFFSFLYVGYPISLLLSSN